MASQRQTCTNGRLGESYFRIEKFTNIRGGQKGELGGKRRQLSERALLSAPYKIVTNVFIRRFDSPRLPMLARASAYVPRSTDRGTKFRMLEFLTKNHHELFQAILTKIDSTANMQIMGGTY